jgi:hypothetical protein
MPDQSRESEKQILTVQKDIEHLKYIIDELEKGNSERLDDIKLMHGRIDKHQNADLDFHDNVRKKISCRFDILDERIRQLDRWKWATWGALIVIGALCGYYVPIPKLIGS